MARILQPLSKNSTNDNTRPENQPAIDSDPGNQKNESDSDSHLSNAEFPVPVMINIQKPKCPLGIYKSPPKDISRAKNLENFKKEKPFHQQGAKENKAFHNHEAPKHVQLHTT